MTAGGHTVAQECNPAAGPGPVGRACGGDG